MPNNNEKTELKIEGMHCVSCEETIGNALKKIPGVIDAKVSFVAGEAKVISEAGKVDRKVLINTISETGYKASPILGHTEEVITKGE